MSISNNNADFEQESDRLCEEQSKYYDKLDYHKVFSDKKEVIRHFIESEDVAKEYVFQGKFYPMAHYEIAKILKTKMKGFDENEIVKTLYHTLRLGTLYKIDEVNYPHLQKAMTLLLPDLETSKFRVCGMNRQLAYLLFEVVNEKDIDQIQKTNYTEYTAIKEFILEVSNYNQFYENLLDKHKKFNCFLNDTLLLKRVKKAVIIFSENKFHQNIGPNFYFAACVLLLLLSEEEESKQTLLQLHQKKISNHLVWVLGTFYKDFQNTEANKKLLINLYEIFPHDWINEYQEKKYGWQNN
ncbi:hypothetical protein [Flavobacterium piscis]|uniref:Uncharacterized protein n=1 Tax=Flavobacterium piscis TaxID=1114874 RepID=A0ABU1YCU1_9FLAO|nr:hypothetical protein [Flavobacterium piscis]MDR7212061.1 hypothetical protein [Flavobacterium piscis]